MSSSNFSVQMTYSVRTVKPSYKHCISFVANEDLKATMKCSVCERLLKN